ncbi:hypothetical protein CL65_gp028 [Mycobacterium phage Patience]|uniref:Uncharacterized protein n=2 Tax=Patiencevirus patience TaxID=1982360 RepID=A0A0K1LT51_9CAUD|nr:hypothetical protein CL65_gp028 [Mycobacterium phage Patience]AEL97936.1 hypothetical protein PATIENCE_27 [Mycobacterium phage Patience]AKU45315.1 hypothetical protein MADRUGA_25 [Mycobacterium phage Madruga]
MAKVGLEYNDKLLRRNIKNFDRNVKSAVRATVDRRAAITQADLRNGARWTDRTGAARSGLMAIPVSLSNAEEIFMAYSVTYGIWLEVAHDRKYAIITPMMRIAGEALMNDLQYLLDRLGEFQ